ALALAIGLPVTLRARPPAPPALPATATTEGKPPMKPYRLGAGRRALNYAIRQLITLGLAGHNELLTVTRRTTGRPRLTPVRPLSYEGQRWLVAPYGPVSWVKNARAAGEVTLSHGRHRHTFTITEAGPGDSAAVLREYVRLVPVTRPYFTARP